MKVAQQVSISIMQLAMDTAEVQAVDMTKMAEQSVTPHIGEPIDINL